MALPSEPTYTQDEFEHEFQIAFALLHIATHIKYAVVSPYVYWEYIWNEWWKQSHEFSLSKLYVV